jgi:hypothetical protein
MNFPLLSQLFSEGPAPEIAREMELYGRLSGRWRTSITYFPLHSSERTEEGEWTFGYALNGRAVIDLWEVPARTSLGRASVPTSGECGLCVRVYDSRLKLWRFTFHGPVHGVTINMLAYEDGSEIVQERFENGRRERWIFSQISHESFRWRAIVSTDGGSNWRLTQTVVARRTA